MWQADHILQCGTFQKIKLPQQSKTKKFFVIREISRSGIVTPVLEYYENEKKFRTNVKPNRQLTVDQMFGIVKRQDKKMILLIFTNDKSFGILFSKPEELEAWHQCLVQLAEKYDGDKPHFDQVWQVNVESKGLVVKPHNKISAGPYRLCLQPRALMLFKVGVSDREKAVELQLAAARRCGHAGNQFFLEMGHAASTGEGEIWMKAESEAIAQALHDLILHGMKVNATDRPYDSRPRSTSNVTESFSRPGRSGSKSVSTDSKSKFLSLLEGSASMSTSPSDTRRSTRVQSLWFDTLPFRLRTDSMDSRASGHSHSHTDASSTSSDVDHHISRYTDKMDACLSTGEKIIHTPASQSPKQRELGHDDNYTSMKFSQVESSDDDSYIITSPTSQEDAVCTDMKETGYMEMDRNPSSISHGSLYIQQKPTRGSSHILQEEYAGLPPRAHSVGSRPSNVLSQSVYEADYLPMGSSASGELQTSHHGSRELSECHSSSRSGTPCSSHEQDHFMLFNFQSSAWRHCADLRDRSSSASSRGEVIGREEVEGVVAPFRDRASSYESQKLTQINGVSMHDLRNRAQSAGNRTDVMQVTHTDQLNPDDIGIRHRTFTISQESPRLRTSSFGKEDAVGRPRSSSYGQSRYKEISNIRLRQKEVPLQKELLIQNLQNQPDLISPKTLGSSSPLLSLKSPVEGNYFIMHTDSNVPSGYRKSTVSNYELETSKMSMATNSIQAAKKPLDCTDSYAVYESPNNQLEKTVSPIREEDNESLYGPKPIKAISTQSFRHTGHEYVNYSKDELRRRTASSSPKAGTQGSVEHEYSELTYPQSLVPTVGQSELYKKIISPEYERPAVQDIFGLDTEPIMDTVECSSQDNSDSTPAMQVLTVINNSPVKPGKNICKINIPEDIFELDANPTVHSAPSIKPKVKSVSVSSTSIEDIFGLRAEPENDTQSSPPSSPTKVDDMGRRHAPLSPRRQISIGPTCTAADLITKPIGLHSHGSSTSLFTSSELLQRSPGHTQSKSSVSSESTAGLNYQLNYATLDLTVAGSDDNVHSSQSPRSSTSSQISPMFGPQSNPVAYSEIDFEKSDEMKVKLAIRESVPHVTLTTRMTKDVCSNE